MEFSCALNMISIFPSVFSLQFQQGWDNLHQQIPLRMNRQIAL
jgi:hypothetical protein